MLYEDTIKKILKKDKFINKTYYNVYARDELPTSFTKYPVCIILNTQNRSMPGEHWLAIYIDTSKKARFFDSFGLPPSFYQLHSYMNKLSKKWSWNQKRLQGLSEYCGFYCILFLIMASRGILSQFYDNFSNNVNKNDLLLENLIKKFSINRMK